MKKFAFLAFLIFLGGYFVYRNYSATSTTQELSETSNENEAIAPTLQESNGEISVVVEPPKPCREVPCDRYETIYVQNIASNKKTEVFKREASATGIESIVSLENSDSIVLQIGGPFQDIALISNDGRLISESLQQSNPELERFYVSFGEQQGSNFIVNLFNITNETGKATINANTGKMVPGTLSTSRVEE